MRGRREEDGAVAAETENGEAALATSKARALLNRLATTDHRRSLAADRIFRQLRKEEQAKERRG